MHRLNSFNCHMYISYLGIASLVSGEVAISGVLRESDSPVIAALYCRSFLYLYVNRQLGAQVLGSPTSVVSSHALCVF